MKHVKVELEFEVSRDIERLAIKRAKDLGVEFKGDDDLRDAVHGIICDITDINQGEDDDWLFGGALRTVSTLPSSIIPKKKVAA